MSEDWRIIGQAGAEALADGRFSDAIARFTRLVELVPDHADSWFNLAYALRQGRRYTEAAEAYERSIGLGLSGAEEARVNRALILSDHLDRLEEAELELRHALLDRPDFSPALLNLGVLFEDKGDRDAALETYRELAKAEPGNGRAHARIAALNEDPEEALAQLELLSTSGSFRGEHAAEIVFAKANILDRIGRYGEAFDSVDLANSIMASLRPTHLRYDPVAQERLVSDLIEIFPGDALTRSAGDSCDEARALFVCGMFRSGSTVAEQLLGRHPEIATGGELEYIPAFVGEFLRPYPQSLAVIGDESIAAMGREYSAALDRLGPQCRYVTDKRPDNFLHLGLIKTLFPRARVVHTSRNPLDTMVSTYFLNFAESVRYSERLEDIAHYLGQYRRLMRHWQDLFGDDIVALDYDRLVADPERELGKVFDALVLEQGVAVEDDQARSVIRTPSAWQARSPLHANSSGRWQNYAAQLAPFRHLLEA